MTAHRFFPIPANALCVCGAEFRFHYPNVDGDPTYCRTPNVPEERLGLAVFERKRVIPTRCTGCGRKVGEGEGLCFDEVAGSQDTYDDCLSAQLEAARKNLRSSLRKVTHLKSEVAALEKACADLAALRKACDDLASLEESLA